MNKDIVKGLAMQLAVHSAFTAVQTAVSTVVSMGLQSYFAKKTAPKQESQ
jgi:hypothetical protein